MGNLFKGITGSLILFYFLYFFTFNISEGQNIFKGILSGKELKVLLNTETRYYLGRQPNDENDIILGADFGKYDINFNNFSDSNSARKVFEIIEGIEKDTTIINYLERENRALKSELIKNDFHISKSDSELMIKKEDPVLEADSSNFYLFWPFFLYLTMILGILSNQYYEYFKIKDIEGKPIVFKSIFSEMKSQPRTYMGLVISPLIFFASYMFLKEIPDNTISLFYAYQNGFFWYALSGIVEKKFQSTSSLQNPSI